MKRDIATWLGLSSVPVGRATHWPHGGRTKLQPNEKTTKHYANVLAIECHSSECLFLREEVADFRHHGTSYRIIRNKDTDSVQNWVTQIPANEAPPHGWEGRLNQHPWELADSLNITSNQPFLARINRTTSQRRRAAVPLPRQARNRLNQ